MESFIKLYDSTNNRRKQKHMSQTTKQISAKLSRKESALKNRMMEVSDLKADIQMLKTELKEAKKMGV